MREDEYIDITTPGRASRVDKWKYNDILNDLARQAWYNLGTPWFTYWAKRFIKALSIVNIKNLPLKKIIHEKDIELKESLYYNRTDKLKKKYEIWNDPFKRDIYLHKWEEEYWETLFDYCLDLATQSGFTLVIDSIDESVALRV